MTTEPQDPTESSSADDLLRPDMRDVDEQPGLNPDMRDVEEQPGETEDAPEKLAEPSN